jgi:6-pyruvoyltetrahydropterin/6-carboxytetrahydropterin synthase
MDQLDLVTITSNVEICASHRLLDYVGRCASLHGHNYVIEAEVVVPVPTGRDGISMDFKVLKDALKKVTDPFDHATILRSDDPLISHLGGDPRNQVITLSQNPTAEHLANLFYWQLVDYLGAAQVELRALVVTVHETRHCKVMTVAPVSRRSVEVLQLFKGTKR